MVSSLKEIYFEHKEEFAMLVRSLQSWWRVCSLGEEFAILMRRSQSCSGVCKVGDCSTVQCRYNMVNFSHKYSQKTPHSSPVRVSYGVSFVNPASDWYWALVFAIIYAIFYYIGLRYNDMRYNDTLLYCANWYYPMMLCMKESI